MLFGVNNVKMKLEQLDADIQTILTDIAVLTGRINKLERKIAEKKQAKRQHDPT